MINQQLTASIAYRLKNINDGEVFSDGNRSYLFYRKGKQIGVAVDSGETNWNLSGIHPAKVFTMESCTDILGRKGNFITIFTSTNDFSLDNAGDVESCANIFCSFVDEESRKELLNDPRAWADKMIDRLGNTRKQEKPYPYIAEIYAVNELLKAGLLKNVDKEYRGPDKAVHDIETESFSIEVKSHLYAEITDTPDELVISSQMQLKQTENKPLYVVYFRMEEASGSLSLQSVVNDHQTKGGSRKTILKKLEKSGYVEGDLSWTKIYHFHAEPQVYYVSSDFPKITPDLFPNGHWPTGISKLIYHVSLKNIPSCSLNDFIQAKREGKEPVFVANTKLSQI